MLPLPLRLMHAAVRRASLAGSHGRGDSSYLPREAEQGRFPFLIGWLAGWLTGWLTDWLASWRPRPFAEDAMFLAARVVESVRVFSFAGPYCGTGIPNCSRVLQKTLYINPLVW